jgi:hypothetical protein
VVDLLLEHETIDGSDVLGAVAPTDGEVVIVDTERPRV